MSSSSASFLSNNVKRYYDLTLQTDLKWANGSDGVEEYFNRQSLVNFEAIKKHLDMNISQWTPERDDAWYFQAVGCLVPLFGACEQELNNLDKGDFLQYSKYFVWTSHPGVFEESFKLLRDTSNTAAIESVLIMSSVLERSLGNLLVSVSRVYKEEVKIPSLLRDLISMPELLNYLGAGCIIFLKILLGTPLSLNLRNVVWHGFINPEELSSTLASTLFFVIATIGQHIECSPLGLVKRPLLHLNQAQLIKRKFGVEQKCRTKMNSDSVDVLILNSNIFPIQHREILLRVFRYNGDNEAGSALILGLPLLELILRNIFVLKNGCPERLLAADANCLYTTLNEIFAVKLEDDSENKIQEELGEDLLTVLYDLLVLPEGPRIRDKFSHGEVNFSLGKTENEDLLHLSQHLVNIITILLWKYVGNLNCPDFSEIASVYDNYTSVFHPSSLLAKSAIICVTLLKKIPQAKYPDHESLEYDDINFSDPLSEGGNSKLCALYDKVKEHFVSNEIVLVLENSDMDSLIVESLSCYKGSTLYRPREEYEILSILQQIVDQIEMSAERTLNNMEDKLQQHLQKLLRSRQRNTYKRMLQTLPRVFKTFMGVLLLITYTLLFKEKLANNVLYRKRLKIFKRCLKNCENITTFVQSDCNKWVEVSGCLEGIEKVIDDYPLF